MSIIAVILILTIPAISAIYIGCRLFKLAFTRQKNLPEEIAFAGAWIFVVGSLIWLGVYLSGSTLLGFGAPWTWLAAAHFAVAGFGALTITAFACRVVSSHKSLRILRALLLVHPIIYFVTAAGISGIRYCDEIGALSYEFLFLLQLGAVIFGGPERITRGARFLFILALTVPIVTLIPSLAWAWNHPLFDISGMVRYHGMVNAVGHVGLGLAAMAWGRPPSHAVIEKRT